MHIDEAIELVDYIRASILDDFGDLTDEIIESECDDEDQALLAFGEAYSDAVDWIEKLTRQNDILQKAIRLYADRNNWASKSDNLDLRWFALMSGNGWYLAEQALKEVSSHDN